MKIKQDITLCNEVLGSTLIEKNAKLINFLTNLEEKQGTLHLMGMVSNGCVHSDITYMKNFITHLKNLGVTKLYFHAITDGKDPGTIWEAGYAYAKNIPVIYVAFTLGKEGQFNLMLAESGKAACRTVDELKAAIDGKEIYFEGNIE